MHIGHVQGGTHAGWRTVNAAQPKEDWVCDNCGKSLRYYWVRCPVDGTPRPERD
jgi:hypothetical protein